MVHHKLQAQGSFKRKPTRRNLSDLQDKVIEEEPDRDELVRQFLKNTQQNRRPFAGIVRRSSVLSRYNDSQFSEAPRHRSQN